ncbi:Pol Polyprotein [Phytophthora megakarya]|uniref:RNA-directed DNA polymerase n=1 Tax=Phytophthora megakarya TaxID=4795 RepID=A0A225VDQ9_9STRA|nr:Pol Polyprotein [Phytophthora megakarya]
MAKRRDESVLKFSQRMKENIRMFAELPQDAEEIPEVQQCSELVLYFTRIEKAERQLATRDKNKSYKNQRKEKNQGHKASQQNQYKEDKKSTDRNSKKEKWCSFHKTSSHNTNDCYTLKKKEAEEHKHAEVLPQVNHKKSKRYPLIYKKSGAESDSDGSSDEEMKFVDLVKKEKKSFKSAPLRITVRLRRGGKTFEALLDSGASKSIINKETLASNVKAGRRFIPTSPTVFNTMNGSVTSNGTIVAQFLFPDLKCDTIITHRFEVINDSKDTMIIGRDIMNELGLILNFKDKVVQWDDCFLRLNTGRSNSRGATDEMEDHEFPDETKEIFSSSVKPEDLLPDSLHGEMAANYLALLIKHQTLYDGHLGRMRFNDYEIPLSPEFKPVHAKPYPIARSLEKKAKTKIQQLINADVLEQIYDSEMASPAFFLTKPDGSLRLLVDFRSLNKYLRRSPYYVPRIREILMRLAKAKCISTFDANLGYYARRLAKESRPLTAFCLPFGKFRFKRLPMGISTAPDEYQASMEKIFGDLEFVVVYLDDVLVFSESQVEHLDHLSIVFERLEKPQEKKIQAIQKLSVPRNRKELRRFLGMINYYRDMIPNKTTLCKPLHRFTSSKVPFTWLPNASGSQLGGVIMQGIKILACYSRSLNKHQLNYTTMELELLSIVELLREYRTMLLGFPIVVHTDHKNLIYPTETNLRVKRWKLLLSEYRLTMSYIKGEKNVGADAFSRMRFDTNKDSSLNDEIYAGSTQPECVMHGPVIRQHQDTDQVIQKIKSACLAGTNNPDYQLVPLLGCTLVAYQKRVIVPDTLRDDMIGWYHQNLGHPASERQFKTMRHTLYWPSMETTIAKFIKKCVTCKRSKIHGGKQGYGLLPTRTMKNVNPFDIVHVDLIGPYEGNFYGITIIDQATRWLEVAILPDKESLTTAESFDREWLCRYPRPQKVVHDKGPEFTGNEFQELLRSYGIKAKPITTKNPQANAICERVHLEILNVIRCHEGADWKKVIYYAAFAARASYHSILNASPGQLIFGQDMISRQLYEANWSYLTKRRFDAILADNDRENDKRLNHFYNPGDQVMVRVPKQFRAKTKSVANGPFPFRITWKISRWQYRGGGVCLRGS